MGGEGRRRRRSLKPAETRRGGRWPARRNLPLADLTHYLSLLIGFGLILWIGRRQWFIADEWAVIARRGLFHAEVGLFEPHNEHWITGPTLIFRALFAAFGVRTYIPYLATVLILHLAVAHVVWRILRAAGVGSWIATVLVGTFLVAAEGAENVMSAFQVSFVGALLLGLLAIQVSNVSFASRRRDVLASGLATASLLFAGTSVPLVATTGLLIWIRRGFRCALPVIIVPATVYVIWLLSVGHQGLGSHAVTARNLLLAPTYTWNGLVATVRGYTVLDGAAPAILLAVAYFLLRRHNWGDTKAAVAPAAAIGAVLLYVTIAPGRAGIGLEQNQPSSRYLYLAWPLLLPAIGVALQAIVAGNRTRTVAVVAVGTLCAVLGIDSLLAFARAHERTEQAVKGAVLAAAELVDAGDAVFTAPPHRSTPDLLPAGIAHLIRSGAFKQDPQLTATDRLSAVAALQVRPPPFATLPLGDPGAAIIAASHATTRQDGAGCLTVQPLQGPPQLTLTVNGPTGLSITSHSGGEMHVLLRDPLGGFTYDPNLALSLRADTAAPLDLAVSRALILLSLPETGTTTVCGAHRVP